MFVGDDWLGTIGIVQWFHGPDIADGCKWSADVVEEHFLRMGPQYSGHVSGQSLVVQFQGGWQVNDGPNVVTGAVYFQVGWIHDSDDVRAFVSQATNVRRYISSELITTSLNVAVTGFLQWGNSSLGLESYELGGLFSQVLRWLDFHPDVLQAKGEDKLGCMEEGDRQSNLCWSNHR